jgi:hypothetical protein
MIDANEPTLPLNNKCTKRGCNGSVDFPDMGEVYDGERGRCDTCGCPHVAVAYEDAMRVHARDEEPENQ